MMGIKEKSVRKEDKNNGDVWRKKDAGENNMKKEKRIIGITEEKYKRR